MKNARKRLLVSLCALGLAACQPSNDSKQTFKNKAHPPQEELAYISLQDNTPNLNNQSDKYYEKGVKAFKAKDYLYAQKQFTLAAEANHPIAMMALGDIYRLGLTKKPDVNQAKIWYEKGIASKNPDVLYHYANLILQQQIPSNVNVVLLLEQAAYQKHSKAQLTLAKLYQQGQIVPQSTKLATKWFLEACGQEPEAMTMLGIGYIKGTLELAKNQTLGIQFLNQAASLNYYPAQYALACLYLDGFPVLTDKFQAIEYLQKAAKGNQTDAQVKLAKVLMQFSLPEYDRSAYYWLNQAVQADSDEARYWLARCYLDGIGTAVDYDRAFDVLAILAQNDYSQAYLKLGELYYYGQGTAQDTQLAKKWALKAAKSGHLEAKDLIAKIYQETTDDVDGEEIQAQFQEWLQMASNENQVEALYLKGIGHFHGKNQMQQNIDLGLESLQSAAKQNYVLAQLELGKLYEQEQYGLENPAQALRWYSAAAENGDKTAQLRLAYLLYNGIGCPKDPVEAYAWANMVALTGSQDALNLREQISDSLTSTQLKQAQIRSDEYFSKKPAAADPLNISQAL